MNMKLFGAFSATLAAMWLLVLSGCSPVKKPPQSSLVILPGADFAQVRSEARKLIQGMLEEELVPGLSIALVSTEGPLWLEGFGQADTQTATAATAETVYRIGSLSKPLTALAVMQLSRQQQISLDAPLATQLTGFSIRRRDLETVAITPRQLLSHRSGLPSDLRKGMYTATPFTRVTRLLHDEYIAFPPDRVYAYSNLGYDLLGHLIEEKSGLSFRRYQQTRLFEPLKMRHTDYVLTPAMQERLAAGHLDAQVRPQPPLRDTPALGLYSTAQDMGRLMVALLRGSIPGLDAGALIEMWTPQTVKGQISLGFYPGLGWFVEDDEELGRVVRHGGSTLLFGAEMALLPDQGLGIAVLANGAGSNRVARQLAATILHLSQQIGGSQQVVQSIVRPEIGEHSRLIPSGGYATDLGLLMVDPERPRLCACIIERMLDMVRFDDGSYGLTPESAASLPPAYRMLGDLRLHSRHIGGKDVLLADHAGEEIVLGSRIEAHPWEQEWRQRIGRYRTINPDGAYSIKNLSLSSEQGVLCLHYHAPHLSDSRIRVPLKPVSATEAVIEGLGRGRGETVSIVEINGKQCLRFSGYMGEPVE